MITVRIESLSEYGPNVFMESFNTPMQALVYLTGYIDAAPINITHMSVKGGTAQEWREAIWPTKWECCPPPEERIPSIQNEDEKEGLDPVSPPCKLCPEFADILCQITEFHRGIHLCYRCHRSHIVACYAHFAAS